MRTYLSVVAIFLVCKISCAQINIVPNPDFQSGTYGGTTGDPCMEWYSMNPVNSSYQRFNDDVDNWYVAHKNPSTNTSPSPDWINPLCTDPNFCPPPNSNNYVRFAGEEAIRVRLYKNGVGYTMEQGHTYTVQIRHHFAVTVDLMFTKFGPNVLGEDSGNGNGESVQEDTHISGLTSVENRKVECTIFPNPTTGNVIVQTPLREFSVEIVDAYGREVQKKSGLSFRLELDLQDVSSGIYFARIYSVEGTVSSVLKFVKE